MDDHEGVVAGPMKTAQMHAQWRREAIAAVLADCPNLLAIVEGRVSGGTSEWPALRPEINRLAYALHEAKQQFKSYSSNPAKGENAEEGRSMAVPRQSAVPANESAGEKQTGVTAGRDRQPHDSGSVPAQGVNIEAVADALVAVLPMAKAYAAEHPVGRNGAIVEWADEISTEATKALNERRGV